MEIFNTILLACILVGIGIIARFMNDLPNLFRDLKVEEKRGQNASDLQRESYFRQISGKDLADTFAVWTDMFVDMDNMANKTSGAKGKQFFIKLQKQVIMYGSDTTVNIFSLMMQNVYKTSSYNDINIEMSAPKDPDFRLMVYIAYVISSLKNDFTGYKIDPETLIKIKISDMSSPKNKPIFDKAIKEVKNDPKSNKIDF